MRSPYSLNKSRKILFHAYKILKKRSFSNNQSDYNSLKNILRSLEEKILQKDRLAANLLAIEAECFIKIHPPSFMSRLYDFTKAIGFALLVAFLIRQFWFELYEVPTGSMRPTILEQDRLIVSKAKFGLHIPFSKKIIGLNPQSITRGDLVVFSINGLPITDSDTKYFGFIPGKKRYIKRCIGKPGDKLYFYNGHIYGLDKQGKTISFPNSSPINRLNYVPFISFNGNSYVNTRPSQTVANFKQFNIPCGRFIVPSSSGYGQFFYKETWKHDQPALLKNKHLAPVSYSDLFGMGNYAMVRILTQKQAALAHDISKTSAKLYLEINHTPNLTFPTPGFKQYGTHLTPLIKPMKTLLPLRKEHLHLIRNNLTTSRFVVSQGKAYKYSPFPLSENERRFALSVPTFPDGCYEYIKGEAYKITWGGIRKKLKPSHPLMQLKDLQVIELFNCGINFSSVFNPKHPSTTPLPNRYAFYKQGGLYMMDALVFMQNDPELQKFIETEKEKEAASSDKQPYVAFIERDLLPKNSQAFSQFINNFALEVPEGHILVLGDNYSMSADSREFGFVPMENLLGSPIAVFWPLGHFKNFIQIPISITFLEFFMNAIAVILIAGVFIRAYYAKQQRLFPDEEEPKSSL